MASPSRKVVIEFLGKDRSFGSTANKMGQKSSALSSTVGKLGAAFAGLAIISKTTSFLKESVAEARDSQKVNAQTAAVIKSTGGAANVTAKEFGDLATAISNKTAIDDEQIQAGENMLATFTNVQNRLGKGNDIFRQATKVSADMAVATGTDNVKANVLLGKALNDPAKGLSRLTKIGVTFTAAQEKQVKQMMKAGDVAGAQKVILKELGKEFGGSAEAQATAGEKAATSYNNLKEAIGTAMLPVLDKFFTALSTKVIPAMYKLPEVFAKVKAFLAPLISGFREFGGSGDDAGSKLSQFRETVATVFASVRSIFTSAVSIIRSLWSAFGADIMRFASGTLTNLMIEIRGAFTIIAGIFKVFSSLLKGDWRGVWDGIKQILRGAWTLIRAIVAQGWNTIKTAFKLAGTAIKAIFRGIWSATLSLARAGINALIAAFKSIPGRLKALGGLLKSAGKGVLTAILNGLKGAGGFAGNFAASIWAAIKHAINGGIDRLNSLLDFSIKVGPKKFHVSAPNINHLATGAIVKKRPGGIIANIGEGKYDEGVFPLDRNGMPRGMAGASGGTTINVVVNGALDPAAVAEQIRQMLLRLKRTNGQELGIA